MKTKIIAFYLPQYHCIPENDEWWGKGFTEWTNVKKSKPLFKKHYQPEKPLNDNYYDLKDEKVQIEQSKLAQENGIYGFCYYHYWFNGKLLLEKPMEHMLTNIDITIPFCICWANESWARTWDGANDNYLIKQNYSSNIDDWEKHFNYLLPFFKDYRYIKVNGKPMFIIYKPYLFDKMKDMMVYWDKKAKENGFEGLYYGYQHHLSFSNDNKNFDFGIFFEPYYTYWEIPKSYKVKYFISHPIKFAKKIKNSLFNSYSIVDYDYIWKRIVSRKERDGVYYGAFTSWDNTPRKGKNATIFFEASPEKFQKYYKILINKSNKENKDFLFINAWNEWGEGAHLEPDEKNSYKYLEVIKNNN